ncbi:hypothetical protein [Hyphococcus sp.]|uniref:hypothetical protein n=1 Tax=Hyphococcus sp. TaxID=2038636 RepID=UPI003CCB8791
MLLPNPNNAFLSAVIDNLKKRTKSLKQKWFKPVCDRIIIREDSREIEALELKLNLATSIGTLSYSAQIYEDRWVRITARKSIGQSLKWDWSIEGRLLDEEYCQELVSSIEKTSDLISVFSESDHLNDEQRIELENIWRGFLASGRLRSVT